MTMNELLRGRYYYAIKKILIEQSVYKVLLVEEKTINSKIFLKYWKIGEIENFILIRDK